ncbi:hypothetical protein RJF_1011 [Candidozyma auris]
MPAKVPPQSTYQQLKESPFFKVGLHAAAFAAGVWFIQSPLMDVLVPQI